jgi:hypothetical protein
VSGPEQVFRQEALDHHASSPGPAGLLRLHLPWVRWLYRGLVVAVLMGGAVAYGIRVDERASGPAVVATGGETFAALLPVATTEMVEPGTALRIRLQGGEVAGRAQTVETVDGAQARRAGFSASAGSHLLVRGVLDRPVAGASPGAGQADVRFGSRRLLSVLLG